MSKLWKKFKNWLIRKLGGHPDIERVRIVEHSFGATPITITCQLTKVDWDLYRSAEKYKELVERQLIGQVSEYLYEHREGLLNVQVSVPAGFERNLVDLKTTVKVIPVKIY